jgi:hypoxanthine phosphoribosyltransferase
MKYVTLADLAQTIRKNIHRIPHDIDFIIGIPRSGLIVASIIAEFLNLPLIDLNSFIFGASPSGGRRLNYRESSGRSIPRVLVVDDTLFGGTANRDARRKLEPFKGKYQFIYLVAYHEGRCNDVDIALEDVRGYTNGFTQIVLYEWNILQHHADVMDKFIFDMDGVLCLDPPDERNKEAYQNYIRNAVPLFLPAAEIGEIVTYRLDANRGITQDWLTEHGVKYKALTMFPAATWEERFYSGITPAAFKSKIYSQRPRARLFIESEDRQASEIHRMTGRPVYCVATNKIYD